MIIKLYDNENCEYPLIEIKDEGFKTFERQLKVYQESDEYNIDDFIEIIRYYEWFVRVIILDKEVYF